MITFKLTFKYLHISNCTKMYSLHRVTVKIHPSNDLWCFLFYQKKCAFYFKKYAILCLFLKNVMHFKIVACFILNNSHLPIVEALHFIFIYNLFINLFYL